MRLATIKDSGVESAATMSPFFSTAVPVVPVEITSPGSSVITSALLTALRYWKIRLLI